MEQLIKFFKANRGSQVRLARYLNLQPSTISQWKTVPVEHVAEVSEITGIARKELVPDAFRAARENAA